MKPFVEQNQGVLFRQAAKRAISLVRSILEEDRPPILGFAGGETLKPFYRVFADEWARSQGPALESSRLYLADERITDDVSATNAETVREHFLCRLPRPPSLQHHSRWPSEPHQRFNLLILSAGEDGHIASLFPGHPALEIQDPVYVDVADAPKPPTHRVSISRKLVEEADAVFLFFIGPTKKSAYFDFFDESKTPFQCPAKWAIRTDSSRFVFTDLT